MKNFDGIKEGMELIIIADTFEADPHLLEIGTRVTVIDVSPAIPKEQTPPLVKLIMSLEGIELFDLPSRVHVETEDGELGNLALGDFTIVGAVKVGDGVVMLEDDHADGFGAGDIFMVESHYFQHTSSVELGFQDNDGDYRLLSEYEFKVIK